MICYRAETSFANLLSPHYSRSIDEKRMLAKSIIEQTNVGQKTNGNFFSEYWGALLMGILGFSDLVARLILSEKDKSIVNFLMTLFNAIIPNFKKSGGSFKLLSK